MEHIDSLVWHERPVLDRPTLVLALSGWSNAGQVSSAIAWYLIRKLKAALFAEISPDDFYLYQFSGNDQKRPLVNVENGLIQSLNILTTGFSYYKDPSGEQDLIIAAGPEPEQKWVAYAGLLLDLAREYRVEKIIAIGGSFDAIPHTVPTRISGVVNRDKLIDELKEQKIELTNYKGPASLYTLLMVEAAKRDLPMISLWASTPHYVQVINLIAVYDLMLKLNRMIGLKIDLDDARKDRDYLLSQIDRAIAQKPEFRELLNKLEGSRQPQKTINQNLLKEIEDLLKGSQDNGKSV